MILKQWEIILLIFQHLSLEEDIAPEPLSPSSGRSISLIFSSNAKTLNEKNVTDIHLTKVNKNFDCDVFFPEIPSNFSIVASLKVSFACFNTNSF